MDADMSEAQIQKTKQKKTVLTPLCRTPSSDGKNGSLLDLVSLLPTQGRVVVPNLALLSEIVLFGLG